MKRSLPNIISCIKAAFPNADTEQIIMLADSFIQHRDNLPKMTRKKPYTAKDIMSMLKHY